MGGMTQHNIAAIGIDVGGTNIKAVAIDHDGNVLAERRGATVDDRARLVWAVHGLIGELGATSSAVEAPVGLASPGLAAADNRSIRWMRGRLNCVEGLDWSAELDRPVDVLNDAHAATFAEAWCGAAAGRQHVVMLTLGTGVGGGVIADGHLLQGALGRAGHLGHITLDLDGPPDIVQTPGSLESFLGDHSIQKRSDGRFRSTDAMFAAAAQGDAAAVAMLDRMVHALACGVVSLINAFDPQVVVIGGGIARAGDALLQPLRKKLDQYEWRPTGQAVPVVPATLGDLAGAIGAARFAMVSSRQFTR